MSFIQKLQKFGVTYATNPTAVLLFGSLLYASTMFTYILGLNHAAGDPTTGIWISNIVMHSITGCLVALDAVKIVGRFWPLQMLIIGSATYITFTLPVLGAYYLLLEDDTGVQISLASLAVACFANTALKHVNSAIYLREQKKPSRFRKYHCIFLIY